MAVKAKRTKARGDAMPAAELRLEGLEVEDEEVLLPVEVLVLLADALLLEPVEEVKLEAAVAEELDDFEVTVLPDELERVVVEAEVELALLEPEVDDAEDEMEEALPASANWTL